MTVYADDARIPWRGRRWSHLQADTLDELHTFAARLGLKREWFQPGSTPLRDHYDITDALRTKALHLGAHPETTTQATKRRKAKLTPQ